MNNARGAGASDVIRLAMYGVSHLLVDMCCFYILYAGVISHSGGGDVGRASILCFMLYNCAAFGLQIVFGRMADRSTACGGRLHAGMARLGCLLLLAAVAGVYTGLPVFGKHSFGISIACAMLAALGNALFHTGGGTDTLLHAGGKMAPNGFFVAPGAVGVAAGRLIGRRFGLYLPAIDQAQAASAVFVHRVMILAALLALVLCAAAASAKLRPYRGSVREYRCSARNRSAAFIISAAVTVVVLRALVGSFMPVNSGSVRIPFVSQSMLPVIFAVCAALGKALGGVFGDLFGARRTAFASLAASALLFGLGSFMPLAALPAVLLFNFTMPITLCAAASEMPGRYGEAFGLTTVGLLIGSLPAYLFTMSDNTRLAVTLPLIMISAALMALCCGGKQKKEETM